MGQVAVWLTYTVVEMTVDISFPSWGSISIGFGEERTESLKEDGEKVKWPQEGYYGMVAMSKVSQTGRGRNLLWMLSGFLVS